MQIYQGIQSIYTHVVHMIRSIANWFVDIEWNNLVELYPLNIQSTITGCLVIILALSAIGCVKKMSFLLG